MSKKTYALCCVITTAVCSVVVGLSNFFGWNVAVSESATILEGALIALFGAWTKKEVTK